MWRLNQIVVALAMVLIASIATMGQDVRSNYMPGTNFEKYHTYKWVAIEGGSPPNQIVDAQIKQSVDTQLAIKGLTKTDSDTADLYVGYQVALNHQKQWDAFGTGGIRWGGGIASATSSTITDGSLVLDMYDPATKQLVWTGNATKTLNPGGNEKKIQKNLDKAMEKLLKNYPPKRS
jgi:uncharacterized protein DUF4136